MVASAGALLQIATEADLASGKRRLARDTPPDAVLINTHENPLGPYSNAYSTMASLAAKAGRFECRLIQELVNTRWPQLKD